MNKIIYGLAHAVKNPSGGAYVAAEAVRGVDLDKGHLTGGVTTQSCVVTLLHSKRIYSKNIPNTKGSRQQLKQPDGSDVEILLGKLDIHSPIACSDANDGPCTKYIVPEILPVHECFSPLLKDPIRVMLHLMAALWALLYAEEPSTQFGPEWTCDRLADLAESGAQTLKRVLLALHPRFRTSRGYYIHPLVLSIHLWLDHLMDEDFRKLCAGPITLGRCVAAFVWALNTWPPLTARVTLAYVPAHPLAGC